MLGANPYFYVFAPLRLFVNQAQQHGDTIHLITFVTYRSHLGKTLNNSEITNWVVLCFSNRNLINSHFYYKFCFTHFKMFFVNVVPLLYKPAFVSTAPVCTPMILFVCLLNMGAPDSPEMVSAV